MSKAHAKQQKDTTIPLKDERNATEQDASRNYTELQLKVISGEMKLEELASRALAWFYKKAIANHDEALAERIKTRQNLIKEEYRKRKVQRAKECKDKLRRRELPQWKQPKTNEYTTHQQRIIKNEIPLDEVHTNELIRIHLKAKNLGEYALSESILNVILDRRNQRYLKDRMIRYQSRSKNHRCSYVIQGPLLGSFEKALLNGDEHWELCSEDDIKRMIEKLEQVNDTANLPFARMILYYKQNPTAGWYVTTHEEAIALYEKLMNRQLIRPEDWFDDDE